MQTFKEYAADVGIPLLSYHSNEEWLRHATIFYRVATLPLQRGRRNGEPMVVDVHVVDQPGLNAFAASFPEADVIAIYKDVFPLLRATARGLVSHGVLIPEIGTPGIVVEPVIIQATPREIIENSLLLPDQPLEDPERERLAQRIYDIAVAFIISHEFSHIYNGHVDLIAGQSGIPLMMEVNPQPSAQPENLDGLERETLEWDADCSAIQYCLQMVLNATSNKTGSGPQWIVPPTNSIGTALNAMQVVATAVFICGAYFSALEPSDVTDLTPKSHPHPHFRLLNSILTIASLVNVRTGLPSQATKEQITQLGTDPIRSWELLFPNQKPRGGDKDARGKAIETRFTQYAAVWALLHSMLEPLKRGGVLAPAVSHPSPGLAESGTHI